MAMAQRKFPVPQGLILTTNACKKLCAHPKVYTELYEPRILEIIKTWDDKGKQKSKPPLLLSIRSGAPVSMPGMMDSVLNVGLTPDVFLQWFIHSPSFACNTYHRFLTLYASTVLKVPHDFWHDLPKIPRNDVIASKPAIKLWEERFFTHPEAPRTLEQQIRLAIQAVVDSWDSPRAQSYRQQKGMSHHGGTAVTIQRMVFGNADSNSLTGVAFTRNPSTGRHELFGEYLPCAQGEDVVSGTQTPLPLCGESKDSLQHQYPKIFQTLKDKAQKLEKLFGDMQDIEFTAESGSLWILQSRSGHRTALAAGKIAVDRVQEGLIDQKQAISELPRDFCQSLMHATLHPTDCTVNLGKGLPASPGGAVGYATFDTEICLHNKKKPWILIRSETRPEDIPAVSQAQGVITARGGMTSHAAVVARSMGRPCVTSLPNLTIDSKTPCAHINGHRLQPGDPISLSGSTGEVFYGHGSLRAPESHNDENFQTLLSWADTYRSLKVLANAETPVEIQKSFELGAEGIGLCRTEHMFFDPQRLIAMQCALLEPESKHMEQLRQWQEQDFAHIFDLAQDRPVTIRLLDPPLHEFFSENLDLSQLSAYLSQPSAHLQRRIESLQETNPMLGCRGARLGLISPSIYDMQVRAIIGALRQYPAARPQIMIPFVTNVTEFIILKKRIQSLGNHSIPIGAMIEVPHAALCADTLAQECDFLCFGTNDLTQMTLGVSRDDGQAFQTVYQEKGIFPQDPFATLSLPGVRMLIKHAVHHAKKAKPQIHLSVCGEHAADPQSMHFFHQLQFDAVSCSAYRVPTARLCAAQSALRTDT